MRPDNYASHASWITNTPIDIHSQHPDILQQDFFERPADQQFDVVSCSLVLNFVSDPLKRGECMIFATDVGEMLRLIHKQLKPATTSRLFLVLPLPCVTNSRYLDRDSMVEIMAHVGFELLRERFKTTGKVGYWLWGWRLPGEGSWSKKRIVNEGPKRNNFAILLDDEYTI